VNDGYRERLVAIFSEVHHVYSKFNVFRV
jgi:hypothetical protein